MKIAVLSSHTSSLFWFRLDMMKDFIKNGHTVIAFGPESEEEWTEKFLQHQIIYKQVMVERTGMNPLKDLKTLKELYILLKKEKPDKIFTYQAKTIVYGSIAAKLNGISEVYTLVAGLGSIFRGKGFKNKIIKLVMKLEYRIACSLSSKVFFQNQDDKNEFLQNGILKEDKVVLINGSGVNLEKFKPTPFPKDPALLFIGRLIKDKGIIEYLEACKMIKEGNPDIRCLLVGPFDSNPSALKPSELNPFIESGIIEYFGEQNDVSKYISQSNIFVLPSYHEGTPKTVLEAMAMGRAIITSDAPGCRETVIEGKNGYLVRVKNVNSLAKKMLFLIKNPEITADMGKESYKIAEEKYDVKLVNQSIMRVMNLI